MRPSCATEATSEGQREGVRIEVQARLDFDQLVVMDSATPGTARLLPVQALRGPKAAAKYAKVWLPQGSPLAVYTQRLAEAMQSRLPGWRVVAAMRYGEPSLKKALIPAPPENSMSETLSPLFSNVSPPSPPEKWTSCCG